MEGSSTETKVSEPSGRVTIEASLAATAPAGEWSTPQTTRSKISLMPPSSPGDAGAPSWRTPNLRVGKN
jgi:hypothetical protein